MTLINYLDLPVLCNNVVYPAEIAKTLSIQAGVGYIVDYGSWHSNPERQDIFTPDPHNVKEKDGKLICQNLLQHI